VGRGKAHLVEGKFRPFQPSSFFRSQLQFSMNWVIEVWENCLYVRNNQNEREEEEKENKT